MNAYLLDFSKRINSTKKQATGGTHHDVVFKQPCNELAPVIVYKRDDDVINHNYLKLQFDGWEYGDGTTGDWRYYFLTDRIYIDGDRVECHYAEDVLGTYRNFILNSYQYIDRAGTALIPWDCPSLVDDLDIVTPMVVRHAKTITSPFSRSSGAYIVGLTLEPHSSSNPKQAPLYRGGSVNYFLIAPAQFMTFVNRIKNLTGVLADINPLQYIVSCRYLPFSIDTLRTTYGFDLTSTTYRFKFPTKGTTAYKYAIEGSTDTSPTYTIDRAWNVQSNNSDVSAAMNSWRRVTQSGESSDFTELNEMVYDATGVDPYEAYNINALRWTSRVEITTPPGEEEINFVGYALTNNTSKSTPIIEKEIVFDFGSNANSILHGVITSPRDIIYNKPPYRYCRLFIPGFGELPIDLLQLIDPYISAQGQVPTWDELHIEYCLDITTGHCNIYVSYPSFSHSSSPSIEPALGSCGMLSANIMPSIQLSSATSNSYAEQARANLVYEQGKRSSTMQMLGGATAMVGGAITATANPLAGTGAIAGGVATLYNGIASRNDIEKSHAISAYEISIPKVMSTGAGSGTFTILDQDWSIVTEEYACYPPDVDTCGSLMREVFQVSDFVKSDDCSGYCKCVTVDLDGLMATKTEKDMITQFMLDGFYIE